MTNILKAKPLSEALQGPTPEEQERARRREEALNAPMLTSLRELNLETELLTQLANAKRLLAEAEYEEGIPLSQKVQNVNSIAAIIRSIIELQDRVHNIERLKLLEDTLIKTLQAFPVLRDAFLPAYESELKRITTR